MKVRVVDLSTAKRMSRDSLVVGMMGKINGQIQDVLKDTGIVAGVVYADVEALKSKTKDEVREITKKQCHDVTEEFTKYVMGEWEQQRGEGG